MLPNKMDQALSQAGSELRCDKAGDNVLPWD